MAQFVASAVERKLDKLAEPDFGKFSENWLAVYDNLPMPAVAHDKATAMLRKLLSDCWTKAPTFDFIFIQRSAITTVFTANNTVHLNLNNLWAS